MLDGCKCGRSCIVPECNEVGIQWGRYRADDVTEALNAAYLYKTESCEGVFVCHKLHEVHQPIVANSKIFEGWSDELGVVVGVTGHP